jgi:CubicO group peptidase (beta-lactamase class C family)
MALGLLAVMRFSFAGDDAARIQRVEHGIDPLVVDDANRPLPLDIAKLMKAYNDPALSIAVIDDYRIVWAKAYGVVGTDDSRPVDEHTLFQAGSISKPVAATAMLQLVESGKLSLDENVNTYLKTWKLPDNEFTKDEKVTLRRIASHTAGTTVHGFGGYEVGQPIPTIAQILDGKPPANSNAVRVTFVPGSKMRYSGGGVTIEQLVMTDVTGTAFPDLMRTSVLDKLDMRDSTYEQPLPRDRAAHAAHATSSDGKPVKGHWHIYPEMAAAGLWTTPTDLAKFAIETALAEEGKSSKVLSSATTRERLTAQPNTNNSGGLGFFLSPDVPGDFSHDGADEGFQASLLMNAKTGKGVVIMVNSDNGMLIAWEVMRSVAKEYAWPHVPEERSLARRLALIVLAKGADPALKAYVQAKADPAQAKNIDDSVLGMVGYVASSSGKRDDAIKILERNAAEYPSSIGVYLALGDTYADAHRNAKAKNAYDAALKIDPKNPIALEGLKKLGAAH